MTLALARPPDLRPQPRALRLPQRLPIDDAIARALEALSPMPMREAVTLRAIDHTDFAGILDALYGDTAVAHTHRPDRTPARLELVVVDRRRHLDSGLSAFRAVLEFDHARQQVVTRIAETGDAGLWDQVVVGCTEWEVNGRDVTAVRPVRRP